MAKTTFVVLLTDFGWQDPYVGVLKGVLKSYSPKTPVLDLAHGIGSQNISQAAHFLASSYSYFPKGSIFVCVVDPGVGTRRKIVAARTSRYTFLAPDNGLLAPTLELEKILSLRSVENSKYYLTKKPSNTFHGRDIFAPVAARLASDSTQRTYSKLGPSIRKIKTLSDCKAKHGVKSIQGKIVYFDHFGNAITNITQNLKTPRGWNRVKVSYRGKSLGLIQRTYGTSKKRLSALFNSFGWLELAIPGSSAQKAASLKIGDIVTVRTP